jgi:hypothetical protein
VASSKSLLQSLKQFVTGRAGSVPRRSVHHERDASEDGTKCDHVIAAEQMQSIEHLTVRGF